MMLQQCELLHGDSSAVHKPSSIAGAQRASGCRSSTSGVMGTQVLVVPVACAEVFAALLFHSAQVSLGMK